MLFLADPRSKPINKTYTGEERKTEFSPDYNYLHNLNIKIALMVQELIQSAIMREQKSF